MSVNGVVLISVLSEDTFKSKTSQIKNWTKFNYDFLVACSTLIRKKLGLDFFKEKTDIHPIINTPEYKHLTKLFQEKIIAKLNEVLNIEGLNNLGIKNNKLCPAIAYLRVVDHIFQHRLLSETEKVDLINFFKSEAKSKHRDFLISVVLNA